MKGEFILEKKSVELFKSNYNCAQSVIGGYCEKYGMDFETTMKLASTFGGGMGIKKTCGAVTGACMVIGLAKGHVHAKNTTEKEVLKQITKDFIEEFENKNLHIDCSDILSDLNNSLGRDFTMLEKQTHCTKVIENTIEILDKIINK